MIHRWDQFETPLGVIQILSPTQVVLDRLAAWVHWSDLQSLDQAVLVATSRQIDLPAVEEWAVAEGAADKYRIFVSRLGAVGEA